MVIWEQAGGTEKYAYRERTEQCGILQIKGQIEEEPKDITGRNPEEVQVPLAPLYEKSSVIVFLTPN